MKIRGFKRVAIIASLILCALSTSVLAADNVATVAGVPVTYFDVKREIDKLIPMNTSYHSGITQEKFAKVQKEALDTVIERARKFRYAVENEITVDAATYQAVYDQQLKRYKNEEGLQEALGKERLSDYKASIYRMLTADRAQEVAVDEKVVVTDDEVKAHFDENLSSYVMPRQYRASHILIKVDPSSNAQELEEIKARAEGLRQRALDGEDFYNLAYYNSDDRSKFVGGDIGFFTEGRTVKEFESAVLKMKVGDVSELVRSRFGFHIIKLTDIKEPMQFSYDEVKDKVRAGLEKTMRQRLLAEWLQKITELYPVTMLVEDGAAPEK